MSIEEFAALMQRNWGWFASFLGVLGTIVAFFAKKIRTLSEQNKALKSGVQALLRAQMIADYNYYMDRGHAPIYAKENFENCWQQYKALGVDGVMGGLRDDFMELPTQPPQKRMEE